MTVSSYGSLLDRYPSGETYCSTTQVTPFFEEWAADKSNPYSTVNRNRVWNGVTVAAAALSLVVVPSTPILAGPEPGIPSGTKIIRSGAEYWPTLIGAGTSTGSAAGSAGVQSQEIEGADEAESTRAERDRRVAAASVSAVDDLCEWLQLTDTQVAQLGGVSRRTLSNWRNSGGAYGASSRHLLAVHAFVSQLVLTEGVERARLWLAMTSAGSEDRLTRLSQGPEGLRQVLQLAEPILFPPAAPSRKLVDEDDLEAESEASARQVTVENQSRDTRFAAPPRRPRNLAT